MEATSAQLSELSHYAAVILAPPLQHTRLERVDLIPVEGDRAIVVLATETGWGMSRILAFEEPVPRSEVREIARLLTERYAGLTFQEVRSRVAEATAAAPPDAERLLRVAAYVARKVFQSLWDRNLYVGGAMNMLDQPEFGIGTMRALLKTFEEKRQLIELLTTRAQASGDVQVVIGSEMPFQEMQETSLVAASYRFHDRVLGVLGIVGPAAHALRRRSCRFVEYTARLVSRRLTRLGGVSPRG